MKTLEIREKTAHALAVDIDRLAYLADPFGYWDVVGRDGESIRAKVQKIEEDFLSGDVEIYIDWLWAMSEDANLSDRDRDRARDRLNRVYDYISNAGI